MKRIAVLCLVALLLLAGCGRKQEEESPYQDVPNPIATITLQDGSVMRAELFLQDAPNTVANFVELANSGFYDGLEIFRVVTGVLIQTGDPNNDGTGGPGYSIRGEFSENGYENPVSHSRGTLSMARLVNDKDSAGSQFFILQGSYPEYDGQYAAFGRLMDEESLQVLDRVAGTAVDSSYRPLVQYLIETIRVDTQGHSFSVIKIQDEEATTTQGDA